jgi:hypothetical protein
MKATAACSRISETTAGRSRWRARLRRMSVLAVTAGIVLLAAAACAGHPSTGTGGTSSAGGSAIQIVRLAVAQCMRSHGVPAFPDPSASGSVFSHSHTSAGIAGSLGVSNTVYQAALDACRHLVPNSYASSGTSQQVLSQVLTFAKCMRSHGVPNFPDPDSTGLQVPPGMTQSHQFQTAYRSCESLLPPNAPVKGLTP